MSQADKVNKKIYLLACKAGFPAKKLTVKEYPAILADACSMVFHSKKSNPFICHR